MKIGRVLFKEAVSQIQTAQEMTIVGVNKVTGSQSTSLRHLEKSYLKDGSTTRFDPLQAIDKQLAQKAETAFDSFFFKYHESE